MTYARWWFGLSVRKDGAQMRTHLAIAAKGSCAGGCQPTCGHVKARATLTAPPLSERVRYLWGWFLELHGRRGSGMNGPASLSWPDLDAWARRTKRDPTPWEFRAIGLIDDAFFASVAEASA